MLLAIDIGNSQTAFGTWDGERITHHLVVLTTSIESDDLVGFRSFFEQIGPPNSIGIASVVPKATKSLLKLLLTLAPDIGPTIITHEAIPIQVAYDNPSELGIDRLLVSYAAYELYAKSEERPALVVDFGTATTYNCVSTKGDFLGGCITLGIGSTLRALHEQTAQLPNVEMKLPDDVLAHSTTESIKVGVLFHAVGGLATLIMLYTLEAFDEVEPVVVVTGGFGSFLEEAGAEMDVLDSELLLKGIALVMETLA